MNKIKISILTFAIVIFCGTAIFAQSTTSTGGMTSDQALMNAYGDAARAALARKALGGGTSAAKQRAIKAGEAKIKAGKATTKFVSSVAGSRAVAESITFTDDAPQDLPGQIRWVQNYAKRFNEMMPESGLTANDLPDGIVLAAALSYAAYHGKKADPQTLRDLRNNTRTELLADRVFQGTPDTEKQKIYEQHAVMSVQAMDFRIKAQQTKNVEERRTLEEKAKQFAEYALSWFEE